MATIHDRTTTVYNSLNEYDMQKLDQTVTRYKQSQSVESTVTIPMPLRDRPPTDFPPTTSKIIADGDSFNFFDMYYLKVHLLKHGIAIEFVACNDPILMNTSGCTIPYVRLVFSSVVGQNTHDD